MYDGRTKTKTKERQEKVNFVLVLEMVKPLPHPHHQTHILVVPWFHHYIHIEATKLQEFLGGFLTRHAVDHMYNVLTQHPPNSDGGLYKKLLKLKLHLREKADDKATEFISSQKQ